MCITGTKSVQVKSFNTEWKILAMQKLSLPWINQIKLRKQAYIVRAKSCVKAKSKKQNKTKQNKKNKQTKTKKQKQNKTKQNKNKKTKKKPKQTNKTEQKQNKKPTILTNYFVQCFIIVICSLTTFDFPTWAGGIPVFVFQFGYTILVKACFQKAPLAHLLSRGNSF